MEVAVHVILQWMGFKQEGLCCQSSTVTKEEEEEEEEEGMSQLLPLIKKRHEPWMF